MLSQALFVIVLLLVSPVLLAMGFSVLLFIRLVLLAVGLFCNVVSAPGLCRGCFFLHRCFCARTLSGCSFSIIVSTPELWRGCSFSIVKFWLGIVVGKLGFPPDGSLGTVVVELGFPPWST